MHSATLIDRVFDACVQLLLWLGHLLGMSYKAINVWIFCVIWPIVTLALIAIILYQRRRIRTLSGRQP